MKYSKVKKPNKYHNIKCECNGIKFDSKKEMRRYNELYMLEARGIITELELQPWYTLIEGNDKFRRMTYKADFRYRNVDGKQIVEDVKGMKTAVYKIKRKMMYHMFGILVVEV